MLGRNRFSFCLIFLMILLIGSAKNDFAETGNYFQQKVDNKIEVTLNDTAHLLNGNIEISYTNNSPQTLSVIYFHLWPNAYSNSSTALGRQLLQHGNSSFRKLNNKETNGNISQLNFKVDDKVVKWNLLVDTIDVARLQLNEPLQSGATIKINTPFSVKIPDAYISRLGHDGQAYYCTQWFPKPVVFDSVGWHYFPYLNSGEFYSEFGSYDVYITLPANYVVGATGDLQTESEKNFLDSLNEVSKKKTVWTNELNFPPSSQQNKTLHYHADNVHDFAWFADKRMNVMMDTLQLPSGRIIQVNSYFTNNQTELWLKSIDYMKKSILLFSNWIGEYPYNNVSAFDCIDCDGVDMEYPTITLLGSYYDAFDLEITVAHELMHNWFYGIFGSNERSQPWMDEGLTQYGEVRYVENVYKGNDSLQRYDFTRAHRLTYVLSFDQLTHKKSDEFSLREQMAAGLLQSSLQSSETFRDRNYHLSVYTNTALSFRYLESLTGIDFMDSCFHRYFNQWKFKHPSPENLLNAFNANGQQNSEWMKTMLSHSQYPDAGIRCVKKNKDGVGFTLKPVKKSFMPVEINGYDREGKLIYQKGIDANAATVNVSCSECKKIVLDAQHNLPEVNRLNNEFVNRSFFKYAAPVKIKWFPSAIEKENVNYIRPFPIVAWNDNDKWMAGIGFYNSPLFTRKFEYSLAPMYSFASSSLRGMGKLGYSFFPADRNLYRVKIYAGVQSFAYTELYTDKVLRNDEFTTHPDYKKIDGGVKMYFSNKKKNGYAEGSIDLKWIHTSTETLQRTEVNPPYQYGVIGRDYFLASLETRNDATFKPYSLNLLFEIKTQGFSNSISTATVEDAGHLKLSFTVNKTFSYSRKGKGLDVRFFAGVYDGLGTSGNATNAFQVSGTNGLNDYLYSDLYLGRSSYRSFLSQQFISDQGGLKTPTPFSSTGSMVALNFKSVVYHRLPIKFFADVVFLPDYLLNDKNISLKEFGIELTLIKNALHVYFPLLYSKEISDNIELNNKSYSDLIRFEINFDKLNPLTYLKNIANKPR